MPTVARSRATAAINMQNAGASDVMIKWKRMQKIEYFECNRVVVT